MTIKVHHLRPAPGAKTAKTRVGRGEASKGKTAGRGTKGTGARKNVPAGFEGGSCRCTCGCRSSRASRTASGSSSRSSTSVSWPTLFPAGGAVGVDELVAAGAVRKGQLVKVLGDGDLDDVSLQVTANAFSGSAKEKLAAAGGSATTI